MTSYRKVRQTVCAAIAITALTTPVLAQSQPSGCRQTHRLLSVNPADYFRLTFPEEGEAYKRVSIYKCVGLFDMISDHAMTEEAKEAGDLVLKMASSFIVIDGFSFMANSPQAIMAPAFSDEHMSNDQKRMTSKSIRDFWERYQLISVANTIIANDSDAGANDLIRAAAECIAIFDKAQQHQVATKKRWADEQHELPEVFKEDATIAGDKAPALSVEEIARINDMADMYLFGYDQPNEAEIAENFEVGVQLAAAIKMGYMGWESEGKPYPAIFGLPLYIEAKENFDKFCS